MFVCLLLRLPSFFGFLLDHRSSLCLNNHHWFSDVRCIALLTECSSVCNALQVFISRVSLSSWWRYWCNLLFCLRCNAHAHVFFGYVWCVVHMHRAGQAASQSCVALAVGSIPHRVAYRSGLVPNSDRLQYSCTWSGLQEWPWCTVGSQPNPRLCLASLIWQLVVFRIMHSFFMLRCVMYRLCGHYATS
jgi:hypothetical protein